MACASRSRRALLTAVSLLTLAGIAWRSWLIIVVDPSHVYNTFGTRLDNPTVGCLLARALEHKKFFVVAELSARKSWHSLVTLACLLTARTILPGTYHYSIGFTVDAILVGVLIVHVLQLYRTRSWSWLERPSIRCLGGISYRIYLSHAWGASIGRRFPGDAPVVDLVAGVFATIALASPSYHFIELPILKLKPRRDSIGLATRPAMSSESDNTKAPSRVCTIGLTGKTVDTANYIGDSGA